jgi:hypothetical protein
VGRITLCPGFQLLRHRADDALTHSCGVVVLFGLKADAVVGDRQLEAIGTWAEIHVNRP